MYQEVECALNTGCEDPTDLFSCCSDGKCIIESPFLYIVQDICDEVVSGGQASTNRPTDEPTDTKRMRAFAFFFFKKKQNGVVFNGPCSQNEECSKGSCCLPNGDCFEGILTTDFIIKCKEEVPNIYNTYERSLDDHLHPFSSCAQGGEAANGPCTDTCAEQFACCLPDGSCADGPLTPANKEKCEEKGKTPNAHGNIATLLIPSFSLSRAQDETSSRAQRAQQSCALSSMSSRAASRASASWLDSRARVSRKSARSWAESSSMGHA